ncbi:MAG: hypothetical protein JXR94_14040 [Candidatus Hydrogenedentes bacterium]|nr:hypothetical protein [Candidatus Hydrogenedentota bacterium]
MKVGGRLAEFATKKYSIAVPIALLALQFYLLVRPNTAPLDPARAEAADRVAARVADTLGEHAQASWSTAYVKVARLVGDHGDHLRSRIEAALPARVNCHLVTDSVIAELRDATADKAARLGVVNARAADKWKREPIGSLGRALEMARDSGLDLVVYGTVRDFRSLRDFVFLSVDIEVADARSGEPVFASTFREGDEAVFADVSSATLTVESKGLGMRIAGWALFVLLLPICSGGFWSGLLARESNATNAVCLLLLTLLGTLVAWVFMGFWLGTLWRKVALLLAFGVSGTWNLFILGVLERNRVERKYS